MTSRDKISELNTVEAFNELANLIHDVMTEEVKKIKEDSYGIKDEDSVVLGIRIMAKALKDSIQWRF